MFVLIVGKQQKYKSAVKVVISHYRCVGEVVWWLESFPLDRPSRVRISAWVPPHSVF